MVAIAVYLVLFQSTRPHGARLVGDVDGSDIEQVSIHAPAWGATLIGDDGHMIQDDVSIHAPAWGATSVFQQVVNRRLFQSTRPHGARLKSKKQIEQEEQVSIHAPAWGATQNQNGNA